MVPGGNGTIRAAVPGGKTAAGGRQYLEGAAAQNMAPVGSSAMGEWGFLGMALRGNGTCREQRRRRAVALVTTPWGTLPVGNSAVGERYLEVVVL